MDGKEIIIYGYEDVLGSLEHTLADLTVEDLHWQPSPDSNSIGWLAWHITRLEDSQSAHIMGEKQLWITDGWHEKFNRPADPKDMGTGHTPEQVADFKAPDTGTLINYNKAVLERLKGFLQNKPAAELDRGLDVQWQGEPVKVGWRLLSGLEDCMQHAGQMGYIRGLHEGKGWQKY